MHATIDEEDNPDDGENLFVAEVKWNGERELSVAGQSEHGQSDRKPKYAQEH